MLKTVFLSVTILLVSISTASASILEVRDSSSDSTSVPTGYNPVPNATLNVTTFAYGADLWGNGPFAYTFEYMGHEAGWTNLFISGVDVFNNKTTAVGTTISGTQLSSGWLDFSFTTNINSSDSASVSNGNNNNPSSGAALPDFFIAYDKDNLNVMYLGLNDDGKSIDDDYDDLVVKVTVSAVPEASSVYLLGIGLFGLLVVARRKV